MDPKLMFLGHPAGSNPLLELIPVNFVEKRIAREPIMTGRDLIHC